MIIQADRRCPSRGCLRIVSRRLQFQHQAHLLERLHGNLRQTPCMPAISPRGTLCQILLRFMRLAARLVGRESAWERVTMPVPASAFGPGSHQPFADYFAGESFVHVGSIDDIVAWLQTCEYVTDLELFHERDFWQHPAIF